MNQPASQQERIGQSADAMNDLAMKAYMKKQLQPIYDQIKSAAEEGNYETMVNVLDNDRAEFYIDSLIEHLEEDGYEIEYPTVETPKGVYAILEVSWNETTCE